MADIEPVLVRASSLSGWADCPRRGAAKLFKWEIAAAGYDLRETFPNIGATIGTAVHAAAALTLREKMQSGVPAPLSTATDCAIEEFHATVADGMIFDKETPHSTAAEKQILGMVTMYQQVIAPQVEPLIVEERLEADTGFGLILTGQSDVLAREPGRLRDLKTGKRQAMHAPQIGGYSLLSKSHGLKVNQACVDFVQRVGATKPQPEPVTTPYQLDRAENAAVNVLRHIAQDLAVFRDGDEATGALAGDAWAFAANPSSMLCSAKWCPAHGTSFCTEHKKEIEE